MALYNQKTVETQEEADINCPEVLNFLTHSGHQIPSDFFKSDLYLIRVLEDLIDILIDKKLINITDFPAPVIEKLLSRNKIRSHPGDNSTLEFDNDDFD